MTDLAGAVQKAVFTKLSAVPGMPPVVTEPPVQASGDQEVVVYPFVLLGDDQITDHSPKSGRMERHEFAVHVCMQSVTKLQVRAIQELVRAALHNQPLAADGASLTNPRALNMSTPLLDDGATYVGSQLFTLFAQDV
jgi:hypothetical protein